MCRLSPPRVDSPRRTTPERSVLTENSSQDGSGATADPLKAKQTKIRPFLSPVTRVRGQDRSLGDQSPVPIEKLSAVEHTPERNVLKEIFPGENLNTPTGISATRRQPIKGAAGRPLTDTWRDNLRPRLSELRQTTSTYTETRTIPRSSAAPLSSTLPFSAFPKPAAPPSVQAKTRRRLPVWVQLLLLSAVAGFLFFVYQAMETNEISPFGQPGGTSK